jgi:HEAT repeat protein
MQSTGQSAPSGQQPRAAAAKEAPKRPPAPVPPPEFQAEKLSGLDQAGLIQLLKNPGATTFQKAKACQRLAAVGTKEAVPALAALLTDPQFSHYARYGLEPNPDPAADDALREALQKVKGKLLAGVINSIGHRKNSDAVPALTKLVYDGDGEVAQAAAAALGRISGPQAASALQDGLGRTKGAVRAAVAGAGLVCAEGLLVQGAREQALALYGALAGTDVPKPVRLAAMHGIIAAEISLNRPR